MQNPLSADTDPPRVGVIIPVRSLREGKNRLADVLDANERANLIREMAETVVRAAHDFPVLIVHVDNDVADWATSLGAHSAAPTIPGLNPAIEFGRQWFTERGVPTVIVAHADLPHVIDLRPVADFDGITLVPDRHRDGTNVLCLPTSADFPFSYGPGSFEIHHQLAIETELEVRILDEPTMAWDVDHPDDLPLP